jgi:phage tail protein X
MNKLYSCHLQGRTLLLTLLMLLIAPLSMQTVAQSPCTSSITRQATNGKSTNTNIFDDITLAMTNLLGEGTEAAWVLEGVGTFTEYPDGTARFKGTVKQFGDYSIPRRLAIDIALGHKSYTPGSGGPYNETGVSPTGWYYYYSLSGTLTGLDALAGGQLSLALHQHPFQVGIGANQLFNAEDQVTNGAGGWFEWTVVSQPTNTALQFTDYVSGTTISDIAILLSGTPAEPCVINGSIGDQVYCDNNNNGIFDAGDVVATGLTITLCDANFVTITTQPVDANGKYLFTNLPAGTYNIKFPEATLDGKPQRELGPINVVLGAGQNFLDADKGYYKPAAPSGSIGDQVYCDNNNNGVFDAGDVVATGLTITLCDANFVTITTQPVDANGKYLFTNLAEGIYNIKFPEATLDGKPQRELGPINVVLGVGQNFLDADKGYYKPSAPSGSIGDQVYCDNNNNGLFDTGDIVVIGLTITLCDANFVTITTQPVDANGKYLFTNLAEGTYNIKFPEATLDGKPQRELGPINVVLGAGQNYLDADKGYYKAPVNPCLNDTEKPVFSNCPTNIVKDVTNMSGSCWKITWTAPTAKDNCSTPKVISNYVSGCCLPVGVTTITYVATDAKGNSAVCSFTVTIKKTSCTVLGNTISKTCVNNIPVINGYNLGDYEYIWLKSTSGCPTQSSQAIAGATNQNYTLPSRPTVKTYYVRCARPIGCSNWSEANESNCIIINANECAPVINCNRVSDNAISKSCDNNLPVIVGKDLGNYEYMWLESTKQRPTDSKDAIKGATGKDYALPKSVKKTTYFVRCARPIGCTSWGSINESNCIIVEEADCAPTCSVSFDPNKCYRIINKKSGKAVDVYGTNTKNNSKVIQWAYHGNANQQWRFSSVGSSYFKVMARHSGKYLACHTTYNNSNVCQYDYYSGGYKDWKVECVGNTGYYRLIHRASGKVLNISDGSTADGANCVIYSWNGGDDQLFSIEEVASASLSQASASMLAINATVEADRVRLSWMTNTGFDNDFYTVEKMNVSTGDFEKLSLINNTQYDDQVQTHAFYDMKPTEGDNFYRVKLSKIDGTDKFTDVKKVTFKRMVGFGAFPNPATDELNINLSEYTGKAVDILIYNSFGKVVTREHIGTVANPVHKIFVNDFAAGQYLIRVSAAGKRDATQQVIIQK